MNRRLRDILGIAAIAVLALLCLVLWDIHRALRDTAGQARYTLDNANRLIREAAQTSANLRHATAEWERGSQQQSQYFTAAAAQTSDLLARANADLAALHDSIAALTATAVTLQGAVAHQDAQLAGAEAQASRSLAALQMSTEELAPVLASSAAAAKNLAALSAEPASAGTLTHVDAATASRADATASVDRQIRMIEPVTKKATTPASLAARILGYAVHLASDGGAILAGYVK